MKLCFVSSYPPNRANLSEYANYLVESYMKNKNIDKIIVLANKHKNAPEIEKKKNLIIIRCWETNSLLIPFNILKTIKNLDVDLVHFNVSILSWGTSKLVNIFGALTPFLIKTLLRKKVIVTLHNTHDTVDLDKINIMRPNKLVLLGLWLMVYSILGVDAVTVTLKRYVRILKKRYYKTNINHVPHGTLPLSIKKPVLGKKTILGFGFWSQSKNLPVLVEAFKDLIEEDREIKLIIAGGSHPAFPELIDKFKEMYKDIPVDFIGYVPEKKLKKLFDSSTVVVLPYSATRGASGVLNLACSFGKPVICTDLEDIRELVNYLDMDVIFINNEHKEQLKKTLKKIIYDENLQKRMALNNLKAAKKTTFDDVSYLFTDIFKKITKG